VYCSGKEGTLQEKIVKLGPIWAPTSGRPQTPDGKKKVLTLSRERRLKNGTSGITGESSSPDGVESRVISLNKQTHYYSERIDDRREETSWENEGDW